MLLSFVFEGVQAFADALLIIPKVLAQNSGFDQQETIVKLQEEYSTAGQPVGLDIASGQFISHMSSHVLSTEYHLNSAEQELGIVVFLVKAFS